MPENSKYIEQFERLIRWHGRLKPVAEGQESPKSPEFHQDDLFVFFMNCYHLKDWIKNDPSVPHLKDLVEHYINGSESLSICADLCNGLKHLSLDSSRSGQDPEFGSKVHRRFELGSTSPRMGIGFLVITKTATYDAFELAGQCLMEWETFLVLNGEPV